MDNNTSQSHLIQPHGAVLVLDKQLHVIQYSENLSKLLEIPIHQISVTPINNFLTSEDSKDNILVWLNHADNQYKRVYWRTKEKKIKIWAHIQQTPTHIILELEPVDENTSNNEGIFDLSQYVIDSAKTSTITLNLEEVLQNTCEEIQKITGYDRVSVYQLGTNNEPSVVVGEAIKKGLQSYLGLHFSAHYIPKNIKEKFLKLPLQYIPTLDVTGIKLVPEINPLSKTYTDLSNNHLRMPSNEEKHYIKSMNAVSAVSLAIIHNNKLWGIIVCQHETPKYLSINSRLILTLIANTLAKQIFALERVKASQDEKRIAKLQASLVQDIIKEDSLIYALDRCHPEIMELLFATGMSIYFQGNLFNYGNTPTNSEVTTLIDWLKLTNKSSYATSSLPHDFPESLEYKNKACGLLVLPITTVENNYLMFYRPEFIHSITWAENPSTILSDHPTDHSLKDYIQTITKHSLQWTKYDIKSSEFIRTLIVNKQLHDLLQIKAMHDPLTGLLNYLYLDEQLKIELLRASRENLPVTLMQIHLHSFNKINEEHGQQAGEMVLSAFAKLLKSYFREYDYIYRNGSDEFIILLPGMTQSAALERAKTLHDNIAQLKIQFDDTILSPITIHTGIATHPENGKDVTSIIAATKATLYQAKQMPESQIITANNITH